MEIIVAKTAGFCFGVKRAVDMAFSHQNREGTYTYGPIIHNEIVTRDLEDKGIKIIDTVDQTDVKRLIIRSHGVSPDVYQVGKERGIEIVDATCPYVRKIHRYVEKYMRAGYEIIIAGNKDHPEIRGINGWGNNKCIIIKDSHCILESSKINSDNKYLLVAQTTYKKEVVDEILKTLKNQNIEVEYINTICNATKERQEEVVTIAQKVEVMLVLGSKQSSNSLKLYEISCKYCKHTYFISSVEELKDDFFKEYESVGITAGASTPDKVIKSVIRFIENIGQ